MLLPSAPCFLHVGPIQWSQQDNSPLKLAPTAYALDMTTSVKSAPSKLALLMRAEDRVFPLKLILSFEKSQPLKSKTLSATPLAWPIVFPSNARSHLLGSVDSGGRRAWQGSEGWGSVKAFLLWSPLIPSSPAVLLLSTWCVRKRGNQSARSDGQGIKREGLVENQVQLATRTQRKYCN